MSRPKRRSMSGLGQKMSAHWQGNSSQALVFIGKFLAFRASSNLIHDGHTVPSSALPVSVLFFFKDRPWRRMATHHASGKYPFSVLLLLFAKKKEGFLSASLLLKLN